jgi:hypothetical protein
MFSHLENYVFRNVGVPSEYRDIIRRDFESALKNKVSLLIEDLFATDVLVIEDSEKLLLDRRNQFKRKLPDTLRQVTSSAADFILLKGEAVQRYWPKHLRRDTVDLDIIAVDLTSFVKIAQHLREQGYEHLTTMMFCSDPVNGRLLGSARLENTDGFGDIEIHIGGFPILNGVYLPFEDLGNYTVREEILGENITTLTTPGHLLILLGELMSRERILFRDIADMIFLLRAMTKQEIQAAVMKAQALNLGRSIKAIAFELKSLDPISYGSETVNSFIKMSDGHFGKVKSRFQILMNNRSIFGKLLMFFRVLFDELNRKDRLLVFLNLARKVPVEKIMFRAGVPVYLIFLSDYTGEWRLVTSGRYHFFMTPIGSFGMSATGFFTDPDIDVMEVKLQQMVNGNG